MAKRTNGTTLRSGRNQGSKAARTDAGNDRPTLSVRTNDKGQIFISATSEPDANELYPNERMPMGMKPEDTCLEVYRRFCKNPAEFGLEARP